jgi:hypothetical protein
MRHEHCFVVPSPLNALLSVKPQLSVNTIIPNTVQMTAGSLAREYHGPFVKTKYADAGNYLSAACSSVTRIEMCLTYDEC